MSAWISIAHWSAICGWSVLGSGAPHTANTSSPTYFMSVPSHRQHDVGDAVVVVVQHHADGRRRQALRQRGEAPEVAEQHGHVEPFAFDGHRGAVLVDEALGDGFRHVLREQRGDPPALPGLTEVAQRQRADEGARSPPATGTRS